MTQWAGRRWRRIGGAVTVVAAATALAACGGGGGGDTQSDPPSASKALALNAANVPDVATTVPQAGELMLQLGQVAADYANRFAVAGASLSIRESCSNGGIVTIALTDRDGDGKVSAGDSVTVTLQDCASAVLGNVLAGAAMVIDIAAASAAPQASLRGSIGFGAGLDFNVATNGTRWQLRGSLAFDWSREAFVTSLTMRSTAADDFRRVGNFYGRVFTESPRELVLSKVVRYDQARSGVNLAYRYDSEVLGGSVTVKTPQPLLAYFNTYPETGRLELSGSGVAKLLLTPNFVSGSDQFNAGLDSNGDGVADYTPIYAWGSAVQGYLWCDPGNGLGLSYDSSNYTNPYQSTAFGYVFRQPGTLGVNPTYALQFSREPAAGSPALQFRFRDTDGGTYGYEPVPQNVAATVAHQGAAYIVTPSRQLKHNRGYALEVSSDGSTWNGPVTVRDGLNNSLSIYSALSTFRTPDSLRPAIAASATVLASATDTLQLSAAGSVSTQRSIVGYRWVQLGGTPVTISAAGAAITQLSWATAPTVGLENIDIELTVTDSAGETETSRITIALLNAGTSGNALYFRSTAGDYIGGGQTVLGTDHSGLFGAAPANAGTVSFSYVDVSGEPAWNLALAAADGGPLQVGAYESALTVSQRGIHNGLTFSGAHRACNQIAGRFDVIEVQTDAQGVITKLAVDFEQHCEFAGAPPLFGSLRINSSVPLRP